MHMALYRKWRPKLFSDVVGQDSITSILKHEVASGRVSHAYLFCGSRGTGKTTCAKLLAKAVNCMTPINGGEPCGVCPACTAIDSGSAPDVLEMDAASNNGVEYVRDIRDEVMYTPSELKKRVYIIDEVHMLSASAFNALLKTLEEPPEHVIFILATTELQKIPATIVSRCQRFDFRRIPSGIIAERLKKVASSEGFSVTDGAAVSIARLSEGAMRDALSILELCAGNISAESADKGKDGIAFAGEITEDTVNDAAGIFPRGKIERLIRFVAEKNYNGVFDTVSELSAASMDFSVFISEMINFYRDMLVVKNTSAPESYLDLTENELSHLKELSRFFTPEKLIYHSRLLSDTFASLQRGNSSARISAETMLVRMCDERLDDSVPALLSRISALEDRLSVMSAAQLNASAGFTSPGLPEAEIKIPEKTSNQPKIPLPFSRNAESDAGAMTKTAAETGDSEADVNEKPSEAQSAEKSNAEEHINSSAADEKTSPRVLEKASLRVLSAISEWVEIVKKFEHYDRGAAAFLSRSKAYRVKNSAEIVIYAPDKFSKSMIDVKDVKNALIPLFASYIPGCGRNENEISVLIEKSGEKLAEDDAITELAEASKSDDPENT